MSDERKLTMSYLLGYLRRRLIEAREEKNEKLLVELGNTFDFIEAASFEVKDRKHAVIVEEMSNAVRDAFMGSEWKSNIPSEYEINGASE